MAQRFGRPLDEVTKRAAAFIATKKIVERDDDIRMDDAGVTPATNSLAALGDATDGADGEDDTSMTDAGAGDMALSSQTGPASHVPSLDLLPLVSGQPGQILSLPGLSDVFGIAHGQANDYIGTDTNHFQAFGMDTSNIHSGYPLVLSTLAGPGQYEDASSPQGVDVSAAPPINTYPIISNNKLTSSLVKPHSPSSSESHQLVPYFSIPLWMADLALRVAPNPQARQASHTQGLYPFHHRLRTDG